MYSTGFPKVKEYTPKMVVAYIRKTTNDKEEWKRKIGWINIDGVIIKAPFLTPKGEAQRTPTADYGLVFCYFDYMNIDTFSCAGTVGNISIAGYGVAKAAEFYVEREATEEEIKEEFKIWEGQDGI